MLFLGKFAFKMTFNVSMTQRISCVRQYHGIDHLIALDLRGDERSVFRQLLVNEFYVPAVIQFLDPFIVSHAHTPEKENPGRYFTLSRWLVFLFGAVYGLELLVIAFFPESNPRSLRTWPFVAEPFPF
jgi:hypothetical protein